MSAIKKSIFISYPKQDASILDIYKFCKVKCTFHKDLDVTNFCKDFSCLKPLCPECVKNHILEHKSENTYGDIERVENVLEEAFQVMDKICNYFTSDLAAIDNLNHTKRNSAINLEEKISLAKQKIYFIIESFFSTFSQEAQEIFSKQQNAFFEELEVSKKFLLNKMNEMNNFKTKLKDSKTFLKYVRKLNSTTFYSDNFKYHKEIEQYLDLVCHKLVYPIVDDSKLYSFNIELAKFIYLKNGEIYKEVINDFFQKPPKPNENYSLNLPLKAFNSKTKNNSSSNYKSFSDDLNNALDEHYKKMNEKSPEKRFMDLSNIFEEKTSNNKKSQSNLFICIFL